MKGKILIVEDESLVALNLRQVLGEFGLEVVGTAESADEALAIVKDSQPDLALMDVNIKGRINGIQTARMLLNDQFHVPAIFLTSYSDDKTVEEATRESPYGYLLKPFNPRELKATLQVALHNAGVDSDLRRAHRTLTATVDGAFEAIFLMSAAGEVQFMNHAAEKLTGIARQNAIDKRISELLHLQDQRGCIDLSPGRALRQPIEIFGLFLKTRPGRSLLVDLAIAALPDSEGRAKRYVLSLRKAEKRFLAQEATARPATFDAFDLISMPMVQLDGNGHIFRVNQALVSETGIAPETLVGSTLMDLSLHPDPRIANVLIPKLQGTFASEGTLPAPRNDANSSPANELSQWQNAGGSPPWPL